MNQPDPDSPLQPSFKFPLFDIIIPAYNESARLPRTLQSWITMHADILASARILIVDDGSTDDLRGALETIDNPSIDHTLVRLEQNLGKGAAIREGLKYSSRNWVLICDADGSTPLSECKKLFSELGGEHGMAMGSRRIGSSNSNFNISFSRNIASTVFSHLCRWLHGWPYMDTQCGFKLLHLNSKQMGRLIQSRVDHFGFDLEWIRIILRAEGKIHEVSVEWHEQPGSKIRILRDSFTLLFCILKNAILYRAGK